jgi:excisionase family DNA binding protein
MVTVARASELLTLTRQAVYAAIKRGEFAARRHGGRVFVSRADVMTGRRERIAFYNQAKRGAGPLSDDEFVRRLWESDPD